VFFGESQFSTVDHTSKIALVALHRHLREWGYHLRDAKWMTPHLASFGFKSISRGEWIDELKRHVNEPGRVGHWSLDPNLDLADWPSTAPAPVTKQKGPSTLKAA
jgi:leucyl/phenylalanyl-tRNA--protein transferase